MRIKEVVAIYPDYKYLSPSWRTHLWQILVRIETDLGIVGLGYGGGGNAAVEIVNGHFRELLINRVINNTEDIKSLWDMLYRESIPYGRKGIAIMGLSGIDIALWDLLGKAESVPVYELIGNMKKPRVRAYATGPDTTWYRDLGFTAQSLVQKNKPESLSIIPINSCSYGSLPQTISMVRTSKDAEYAVNFLQFAKNWSSPFKLIEYGYSPNGNSSLRKECTS